MNILQLSKYYPPTKGGIEIVAETISRAEINNKNNVHIISFGKLDKNYTGQYGENIRQIKQHLFINSTPINYHFHKKIYNYIENNLISLIYVHLPNPYMHQILYNCHALIKALGVKIIAVYHSDLINKKIVGALYENYFIKTLHIYDKFICSSNNLYQSSRTLKNLNDNKMAIIPFTINRPQQYKKRIHFSGKLLAVGRIVEYKGFEFLLNTLQHTNYSLKIIGTGPLFNSLRKYESDKIKLLGEVDENEKCKIFSESDLFIMSSINCAETYGMTLVEAFSAGLPVITPDLPTGVNFLNKDEERGKIFAVQSPESLLNALKSFEQNPQLLERCSENAYNFFVEYLSFEIFANKIKQIGF